ncbi:MAG: nucleoside-diphosphate kinase [bacterium]|nr:nucleoside-diphosphate kinase [bacterium]
MVKEQTFIAIKPESVQRQLIGELITRFERRGLKLVAAKLIAPTEELIGKHYPNDDAWLIPTGTNALKGHEAWGNKIDLTPRELATQIREGLIEYYSGRPMLAMIWEGAHAVELGRKTVGTTNPLTADLGSIRGDYSQESYSVADKLGRSMQTLVHASGSVEEAKCEIELWFKKEEILDYDLVISQIMHGTDWGKVKR